MKSDMINNRWLLKISSFKIFLRQEYNNLLIVIKYDPANINKMFRDVVYHVSKDTYNANKKKGIKKDILIKMIAKKVILLYLNDYFLKYNEVVTVIGNPFLIMKNFPVCLN